MDKLGCGADREEELIQESLDRPGTALEKLSPEAKEARKPLPPEMLYDAKQDRVHKEPVNRLQTLAFLRYKLSWKLEHAAKAFSVTTEDIERYEQDQNQAPIGYLLLLASEARRLGWNTNLNGSDGRIDIYHDRELF